MFGLFALLCAYSVGVSVSSVTKEDRYVTTEVGDAGLAFTVMAYNVWIYDGTGWYWNERKKLVTENIVSVMPDFVGVNELRMDYPCVADPLSLDCGRNMYRDLADLLRPYGYKGHFQPSMYYDQRLVEGQAFFTKWRFDVDDVTYANVSEPVNTGPLNGYPFTPEEEAVRTDNNDRIALHVRAFPRGRRAKPMNFFVTHWAFNVDNLTDNSVNTASFVEEIMESYPDEVYFVLGDLNCDNRQENSGKGIYGLLNRTGLVDSFYLFNEDPDSGNTFCNCKLAESDAQECIDLQKRIDYVLLPDRDDLLVLGEGRIAFEPEGKDNLCPSDHMPYWVDFVLH